MTKLSTNILLCKEKRINKTNHDIFCEGQVLEFIQKSKIFKTPKDFVDMYLTMSPEKVVEDFKNIDLDDSSQINEFVKRHFLEIPLEKYSNAVDYKNDLPLSLESRIRNPNYLKFAKAIHRKWPTLMRKLPNYAMRYEDRTSYIPSKHNFLVIPGGRFREYYYWDTYWILLGFYRSGMVLSARKVIENLLYFVDKFGFVPNGNRTYYLNRSQPPFLAFMVDTFYRKTRDMAFLRSALPLLKKEYRFWMRLGKRAVKIRVKDKEFVLNRFYAESAKERPESWVHDREGKDTLPLGKRRSKFLRNVIAATESGWDFSSRWLASSAVMASIETTDILPVDLNAYLLGVERILVFLCKLLNDCEKKIYKEL